jgi:hypothetical protein
MSEATTSTGRGSNRANAITGIITSSLNADVMFAAIKELSLDLPEGDLSIEQVSMILFTYFSEQPKETLTRCTTCHGISFESLDACPFCGGTEGTPLVEASAAPPAPEPKTTKKTEARMTTVETNGQTLTKVKSHGKPQRTEAELDASMEKIHQYKSEGAAALWAVGKEIAHVYSEQLWKLRTNKDDKGKERPRWSSFEAFCREEIGMTPQNARSLMDVAQHYAEKDVREFGTKKLSLILTAPPEDRAALEKKAKKGASAATIAEEVRKAKKKKNFVRKDRSGKGHTEKARAAAAKTKKAAPDKQITIAKILGSEIVKLYEKPDAATMKTLNAETIKKLPRAKKIGDGAIGLVELANDVVEWLNVFQTPGGELAIKLVRERDSG